MNKLQIIEMVCVSKYLNQNHFDWQKPITKPFKFGDK